MDPTPRMTFIGNTLKEACENRLKYIQGQLKSNNTWAVHCLLVIHEHQTHEEQAKDATIEANGVGFGARDATILTSFAKQVLAWQSETVHKYPAPLSPAQFGLLKRLIPKYARQLLTLRPLLETVYPVAKVAKPKATNSGESVQTKSA
jgi:hypothetical protein